MDSFTEKILERARERQKKLLQYNAECVGLKQSVSVPTVCRDDSSGCINSNSSPVIGEAVSSVKKSRSMIQNELSGLNVNSKLIASDPQLCNKKSSDDSPLKNSVSDSNFSKFHRQDKKVFISSEIPGSPQLQLRTLNIQKEDFNMEIKLCSADDVRIEVELQEEDLNDESRNPLCGDGGNTGIKSTPFIRDGAKKQLNRLGKLYSGDEDANISSPIHRTELTFSAGNDSPKTEITLDDAVEKSQKKHSIKSDKGLGALAALANNINQWEKNATEIKSDSMVSSDNQFFSNNKQEVVKNTVTKTNQSTFVKTNNDAIISSNKNKDPAFLSVSERKALFERNAGVAPIPRAPISMPTSFSFEKISTCTSPTKENKVSGLKAAVNKTEMVTTKELSSSLKPDLTDSSLFKSGGIANKVAEILRNKATISQQQIQNDVREQRQKEMDVVLNRFNKNKKIFTLNRPIISHQSESESEDGDTNERTAMISKKLPKILKNSSGIPIPPPLPGNSKGKRYSIEDSPKVAAVLDDIKHIKVKSSKPGKIYPCLSDIEGTTETETEIERNSSLNNSSSSIEDISKLDVNAADTSFGRDVLETVNTSQKRVYYESTTDLSDILDDMDDYLDEAAAYKFSYKNGPTPPKLSRTSSENEEGLSSSSSFQYDASPAERTTKEDKSETNEFKSSSKMVFSRQSVDFPSYVVDGDNVLPLKHTVSFYRKQQTQNMKTPTKQIITQPAIEESFESTTSNSLNEEDGVLLKIRTLKDEMYKQITIISQSSQALNLCYATPEFTGSTEQVEAEKLLLLATHRRAEAQYEIERLSVLKTLHPKNNPDENTPIEKGSLTIYSIILPLKREYVRALNATGGKGHHVVCLMKCAEQVHATKLVSTVATSDRNPNLELTIPGNIQLNDIYNNSTVRFEVYCLQAQEEVLPHEVKYHIHGKKSQNKSTPRKVKNESRLVRPPRESPGGPQAVRSPSFALMGYTVFSVPATRRKNWTLNNTPSMSPLEGIVEMRMKSQFSVTVKHHGFLTMFETVAGFGAWHRRWCVLSGHILSYWKYPEDENSMAPIGSIDLNTCVSQEVGLVHRNICARLHTILVETVRPSQPHDKDSSVIECRGDLTVIRNLLSADTKEERIEWCKMFNKALNAVKMN